MPDSSDSRPSGKTTRRLTNLRGFPTFDSASPVPAIPAVSEPSTPQEPGAVSLPVKPETVSPTPPPPPESFFETQPPASLLSTERAKAHRASEVKLVEPAPSIQALEEKVNELIAMQGEHPGHDLISDIMMTALRMVRDGSTRGDMKILAASLRELRYAFNVFRPYRERRKVTVFGSARTPVTDPEYQQAKHFAEEMVKRNFMIITGAGPGIMEAAQAGAGRENSFGVNIKLPFEQRSNPYIDGDKKLINFRYFFTRKLCFVKEASAIALFPGGFGTHDEMFETLTLIQTGKSSLYPIVFIDKKGGDYWREWADYVADHLLGQGLISEDDMQLFKITDDPIWAADEITRFYSRYHSMRYVKDTLVLRMSSRVPKEAIERFNDTYASMLFAGKGRITECDAFPEEGSEPDLLALPRLSLPFNRRNFGKLRLLIDDINRA
ncbi:MAG: LOG family protein [Planctomycetota bacterium]